MVRLIATAPFEGLLPIEAEGTSVRALDPLPVTLVHDTGDLVAGLEFPGAGEISETVDGRLVWIGPGQALLIGVEAEGGNLVDQSDAWAIARIEGPRAEAVLARLVPLDLSGMAEGQTARTLLGHMTASISRSSGGFEVMVMRSMAGTLVHDLERAIRTSARP